MSEDVNLTLETRDVVGKAVKKLRREGFLPGVIHDHGKTSIAVVGKYNEVLKAYQEAGKHHPIKVKIGNKNYTTLVKTATYDPKANVLNHIVFGAVQANEKVTTEIPIKLSEDIPAERASLIVIIQLDSVEVEALASSLPDELLVDASGLVEIGDKLTVADIKAPEGVVILTEPEHAIATVYEPGALAAANDAAGGDAEPEEAENVESEHDSSAVEGTQADEIRPGGKEQLESKDQGRNPEKK